MNKARELSAVIPRSMDIERKWNDDNGGISPSTKVTDQRDVIVKPNRVFTIGAVRTRPDNGFLFR